MNKLIKIIVVSFLLIGLGSCATKLSPERNKNQQQQVKKQVIKALEDYYKQPFELIDFSYKYESYSDPHDCVFLYCKTKKSGQYVFNVKAIDNPIIEFKIIINDDKKESINDLVDSFKKNQLNSVYCMGLTNYYRYINNNSLTLKQPYTEQAEKYCSSIGQERYKLYQNYYLKHHIN
jgi:hypothetical protein